MSSFDYPNISEKKSNEENMQAARSWMMDMSDRMNYVVRNMENQISELEKRIAELEKGE